MGAADKEYFGQRNICLVLSWQPVAHVAVSLSTVLLQINYYCSSHVPLTRVTESVFFGSVNAQLYIIHEQSSGREKLSHMHNEEILRHAEVAEGLLCVPSPSLHLPKADHSDCDMCCSL